MQKTNDILIKKTNEPSERIFSNLLGGEKTIEHTLAETIRISTHAGDNQPQYFGFCY